MTQFGVSPSSTSPAARRIYEAGREFIIRKQRETLSRIRLYAIERAEHPAPEPGPVENAPILKVPTLAEIMGEVSAKHKIGVLDILSDRRSRPIARARQEFMYRARMETLHSLPVIGRFCRKDHTTVLHGIRAHEERMRAG